MPDHYYKTKSFSLDDEKCNRKLKQTRKKATLALNRKIQMFGSIVLLHLTYMWNESGEREKKATTIQRSNKTMLSIISQILLVCAFEFRIIDQVAVIWIDGRE